jgi:hypothetical protein
MMVVLWFFVVWKVYFPPARRRKWSRESRARLSPRLGWLCQVEMMDRGLSVTDDDGLKEKESEWAVLLNTNHLLCSGR